MNEKVEGFFKVCEQAGLDGEQGVILPAANARHLMLREDVVTAVREGRFRIWALETVDEAIEVLAGVPAGERRADGTYPEGTVHWRIERRLDRFAELGKQFAGTGGEDGRRSTRAIP